MMRRLPIAVLAVFCVSAVVISLSGCGLGTVNIGSDSPVGTTSSSMQPIVGSVYGGHAPLVGAHLYLVQPGTTGYGSPVTSILTNTANAANATYCTGTFPCTNQGQPSQTGGEKFPFTANGSWTNSGNGTDEFVPAGINGVLSDSAGVFYITGDYTCVVGQPVLLIAYGGAPSYIGQGSGSTASGSAQNNTFTITNESVQIVNGVNPSTGTTVSGGLFTYTTSTQQLFYVGESVTVAGNTGGLVGFNSTNYTSGNGTSGNPGPFGTILATGTNNGTAVSGTALTTTSFSVFAPGYNGGVGSIAPVSPVTAVGLPPFNPGVVNMAVLGNCPSSGNFSTPGNGGISFLYMNEVSTAVTAYSFAGFINTAATSLTGNDEFHIGAPNTVQAQKAIANAAITAANLYDIQGSSISTSFAGEGHIARATTPVGAGVVPTATVNTIGNILAACVDSTNTYRADLGTGTQSSACQVLSQYAQDNGVLDTSVKTHQPGNIAQAAFSLARFPQGAGTGTTSGGVQTVTAGTATTASNFVNALYGIPTGNVPFTPNLTTAGSANGAAGGGATVGGTGVPNDFAIAIQWSLPTAASDVSIDASGNVWTPGGATAMYETTPGGVQSTYTGAFTTASSVTAAIDSVGGNVWIGGAAGILKFTPGTAAGTLVGSNAVNPSGIAIDPALNQYFLNAGGTATSSIGKQNSTGTAAAAPYPVAASAAVNCAPYALYQTLDSNANGNNIWLVTVNQSFALNYICRFNSAGTQQYVLQVPAPVVPQSGGFGLPHTVTVDNGNNAWFADKNSNRLYKIFAGGTGTGAASSYTYISTAGLAAPRGVAVDGANTIWVTSNGDGGYMPVGSPATNELGTGLAQFSDAAAVLTPNKITGAAAGAALNLATDAIDPSGNVWATSGPILYQFVGIATPAVTPLALAKAGTTASLVGAKPGLSAAPVSSYGISNNILSFTIPTTNSLSIGETVTFSGFQTSTFLNGLSIVITATQGTGPNAVLSGAYTHANTSPAAITEVGSVSAVN